MAEETNCEEVNKKIRATIDEIIKKFKKDHQAWKDERDVHYAFFKLLFDIFPWEEVKENFVWEYRKRGQPRSWTIALVMRCGKNKSKMVSVDLKLDKTPNDLREKLIKHIKILHEYKDSLFRGYVVPLYYCRDCQAVAPKQNQNMTYEKLLSKIVKQAKESIKVSNIKLISDGIVRNDKNKRR